MSARWLVVGTLCVLGLLAGGPATARAQGDRRDREAPELTVEAGGRTGTCDALLFTPDGRFLLAAGDDKVVRVWPCGAGGLDAGAMRTLRWPSWREQRGGIKAMDLSPDGGKRVAVGGFGARISTVAVLDRASGEILATTYPKARKGENLGAVMAVAWRPDGKGLVYATADGTLWQWDLKKDNRRVARHRPIKGANGREAFNRVRLIAFPDKDNPNRFVSVAESGEVLACDLSDSPAKAEPLFTVGAGCFRAALSADGKWLGLATRAHNVVLRRLDGSAEKELPLEPRTFARALAFDKSGRLAVAVGSLVPAARFYMEADDAIQIYERPLADDPKPSPGPKHSFRAEALAFDKDGRLAVAGGDDHEVTLWDLKQPAKPVAVARGAGRGLWGVRVSAKGQFVSFQPRRDPAATDPNRRGAGPWVNFDLRRCAPAKAEGVDFVKPLTEADGWTVEQDPEDRYRWFAVLTRDGREVARQPLPWNRDLDEFPRCYAFLKAKGGKPTRLAVGHYYGFSLFELVPGRTPKRVMLGTGHAGEVMALAVDENQSWLVTAGNDQTLAGWSLEDFPTQAQLGADFTGADGKLVVGRVDVGSPAWEAGLVSGDAIDVVAVGPSLVFDRDGRHRNEAKPRGTVQDAAAYLANPVPGVSIHLEWKRGGREKVFAQVTSARRRPLWRFFPAFDERGTLRDWLVWMWHNGYYHTSDNGDFLVGWHVNDPTLEKTPAFHPANRLRKLFHKPDVVVPLLTDRDLAAALKRGSPNPVPMNFDRLEPDPVRVIASANKVGPEGVVVRLVAKPRGSNPDLMPQEVQLWVNDYRMRVWKPGGEAFEDKVLLTPETLRAGENQITLQVFNRLGGRSEARETLLNPRPEDEPRLLGLSVGVNDYSRTAVVFAGNTRGKLGNLKNARNDATRLRAAWLAFAGPDRYFKSADIPLRVDAGARPEDVYRALDSLKKTAKPDDRLVVFLAGHGFLEPEPNQKGPLGDGNFVFCGPNYTSESFRETGIPAAELFRRLVELPCRKVVLLDACHSGDAAKASQIRALVPDGQGPIVLAACGRTQLAFENKDLGHGLFTAAVLEALGPKFDRADADGDGRLDPRELAEYVSLRVPELAREIDPDGGQDVAQTPTFFPRKPERFIIAGKK